MLVQRLSAIVTQFNYYLPIVLVEIMSKIIRGFILKVSILGLAKQPLGPPKVTFPQQNIEAFFELALPELR